MTETYVGNELEIFANAVQWKAYFSKILEPFGNKVLEVGAGIGATTSVLCDGTQSEWLCLEPDPGLLGQINVRIASGDLPKCCRPQIGSIYDLNPGALFDSILYIDVLEHIEDDRAELEQASRHLAHSGKIMVLSPAYPFLYSPFDKAIGHFRRYTSASLASLTPPSCQQIKLVYLDSVGLITSLSNRILMKQSMPTHNQILFWDRKIIPISRIIDHLIGFRVGRSVLSIWQRS